MISPEAFSWHESQETAGDDLCEGELARTLRRMIPQPISSAVFRFLRDVILLKVSSHPPVSHARALDESRFVLFRLEAAFLQSNGKPAQ